MFPVKSAIPEMQMIFNINLEKKIIPNLSKRGPHRKYFANIRHFVKFHVDIFSN